LAARRLRGRSRRRAQQPEKLPLVGVLSASPPHPFADA
jgi:hypothetical protein